MLKIYAFADEAGEALETQIAAMQRTFGLGSAQHRRQKCL